jgi:hypothetical protein
MLKLLDMLIKTYKHIILKVNLPDGDSERLWVGRDAGTLAAAGLEPNDLKRVFNDCDLNFFAVA